MIKAEELRIGNWIYYNGKLSKIDLTDFRDILEDNYEINYYKPIVLTEEILLKCGFEHDEQQYYYVLKIINEDLSDDVFGLNIVALIDYDTRIVGHYFLCNDANNLSWNIGNIKDSRKNTKHLHQLQNLYFALTGKELEITL